MNLKALCEEAGVKFYDEELISENGKKIYRISVTKKGGVGLEDCQRLSEILSPIFDVEAPVSGEYFLEVSSPGLERKLSKIEHFELSLDELVLLTTNEKEKIKGKILAVEDDIITLELLENDENKTSKKSQTKENPKLEIKFSDIKKAKTFVEW